MKHILILLTSPKELKERFYMQMAILTKEWIDSKVRKTPLAFGAVFIGKFFVDSTLST